MAKYKIQNIYRDIYRIYKTTDDINEVATLVSNPLMVSNSFGISSIGLSENGGIFKIQDIDQIKPSTIGELFKDLSANTPLAVARQIGSKVFINDFAGCDNEDDVKIAVSTASAMFRNEISVASISSRLGKRAKFVVRILIDECGFKNPRISQGEFIELIRGKDEKKGFYYEGVIDLLGRRRENSLDRFNFKNMEIENESLTHLNGFESMLQATSNRPPIYINAGLDGIKSFNKAVGKTISDLDNLKRGVVISRSGPEYKNYTIGFLNFDFINLCIFVSGCGISDVGEDAMNNIARSFATSEFIPRRLDELNLDLANIFAECYYQVALPYIPAGGLRIFDEIQNISIT